MGVYDQAGRYATLADGEPVVARVLRGEPVRFRLREWLDSRTTPQPGDKDRTADKVAALDGERAGVRPWLMVFEFQSRHDPDKLDVTLSEAARLRVEVRYGEDRRGRYRVAVALVYLRGRCPAAALDMTMPSGRGTRHVAFVWDVEDDEAGEAIEEFVSGRTTWGVLFWIPLMRRGSDPAIVRRWLEAVRAIPSEGRRRELCHIALIFAELARGLAVWEEALEGANMETESPLVNRWIDKAVQRTRLEERRENLVRLLDRKFPGEVTPEVLATIDQQPGVSLLRVWFDEAIEAARFDDFVAVLRR